MVGWFVSARKREAGIAANGYIELSRETCVDERPFSRIIVLDIPKQCGDNAYGETGFQTSYVSPSLPLSSHFPL